MNDFLVACLDQVDCLPPEEEAQMIDLIQELGIEPASVRRAFVVTADRTGRHTLHLSQFLLDDEGRKFFDYVENAAATRPLRVLVDRDRLPDWLITLPLRQAS